MAKKEGGKHEKQKSETPKQVKCFACKEIEHCANKSPTWQSAGANGNDARDASTCTTITYHVYACGNTEEKSKEMKVLLNNQSDITFMKRGHLREIQPARK